MPPYGQQMMLTDQAKPLNSVLDCAAATAEMLSHFKSPPVSYGPVPFYWWAGEQLDRERMSWQLDQLRERGVLRTIVSYPHRANGTSDMGDPLLFTPEWWEFFRWFLEACRERGMTAGFQDYTLVKPILDAIGSVTPGMQGGQMSCAARRISEKSTVRLAAEQGALVVGAWAYPVRGGVPDVEGCISIGELVRDGALEWSAPAGEWFIALVFARLCLFDPMHPESGVRAIDQLYAPFERECPDHFGTTLDLFFQDELDFGGRMPFWSNQIFEAFVAMKGYDLYPLLPALWHDLGNTTEKIRLDYAEVVCARMEECYFKPVFHWHEERGILFGHDNCGRGRIASGRAHYGDYFRAMRWFSAPGCDDPKLHGPRAFKGLKVNSSIAHLYHRPRVWLEGFHSSGWGTTPAEVVAAFNEDFAYGATVVNLHGLYYTTRGGWWEWAPPDFHFRQPYWEHSGCLNAYFTRLCWLLSQGVHRCDVAMVYPIAALDAEPADPALCGVVAHVENDHIDAGKDHHLDPEETAFGLGRFLFDRACDFDFVDYDSLTAAATSDCELRAGPGRYRVLVFPAMRAVRFGMLEKALEFLQAGGVVIAVGALPMASERAGRDDAELDRLLIEIFGSACESRDLEKHHAGGGVAFYFRSGHERVFEAINRSIERDVTASTPLHVLHRDLGDRQVYFLFNPADQPVVAEVKFCGAEHFERWDPWTGQVAAANGKHLALGAREACVLVSTALADQAVDAGARRPTRIVTLDGDWQTTIHPTLDNRHGDFSLPPTIGMIGPQARCFRFRDDCGDLDGWHDLGFDAGAWEETTFSFGPRLEVAGPLAPEADGDSAKIEWRPYAFSRRWGIERDPFLTDWLSGPHGLKGGVPDEFLDFHSELPGSVWLARAVLHAPVAGEYTLLTGARCAYEFWLNGVRVVGQSRERKPGFYAPWSIPHYECERLNTPVILNQGDNTLMVKMIQPAGQRTRAFFAINPPDALPSDLALRWFRGSDPIVPSVVAPLARQGIRFLTSSPPGTREILFVSRGTARLWVDGQETITTAIGTLPQGCIRYHALLPEAVARPAVIAIHVAAPADSHAGDALPEPVAFNCGPGLMPAGDWCAHGLATYSGVVDYQKSIHLSDDDLKRSVHLDLGGVAATAEVRVNDQSAATLVAPPWTCDLTPFLRLGENSLSIRVANTLANHYSVANPTPYAFPHQTTAGLLGPVALIFS